MLNTISPITSILKILPFLLLVNIAKADFSISGMITDDAKNPLNNVEIHVLPNGKSYYTDAKGLFKISQLKAGDYELILLLDNYGTVQRNITLNQSIQLNIELKKLEIDLS